MPYTPCSKLKGLSLSKAHRTPVLTRISYSLLNPKLLRPKHCATECRTPRPCPDAPDVTRNQIYDVVAAYSTLIDMRRDQSMSRKTIA